MDIDFLKKVIVIFIAIVLLMFIYETISGEETPIRDPVLKY